MGGGGGRGGVGSKTSKISTCIPGSGILCNHLLSHYTSQCGIGKSIT